MWSSEKRGLSPVCLCLLVLTLLAALASCQGGRVINCKKMVFAPICRGAGAKRSGKVYFQNQPPQLTYSPRSTNQLMDPDKQPPFWFYPIKPYQ